MDLSLLHPKLVHLPIALAIIMPMLSMGLFIAWLKGYFPKTVWFVPIVLQGVLVASGFAALRTGESDEERVERIVPKQYIEAHEHAAERFVWAGVAVLVIAAAAGIVRKSKVDQALGAATVVGTFVVLFFGYQTGEAGGQLVYKYGAANAFIQQNTGAAIPATKPQKEEHDD